MAKPMSRRPPAASPSVTLYTPAEAGERVRASESHIYRLIAEGALRAVDIAQPGSRKPKTRVRSDDLDTYIEKSTRAAPAEPRPAA
jgi:excisionase family DNA binding protein